MALPTFLRAAAGSVQLAVKAQPRASRTQIVGPLGNELKIKVAAAPVDDAANEALLEFLTEKLGCSKSAVQLIRGHTSTHKTIAIIGIPIGTIAERLGR